MSHRRTIALLLSFLKSLPREFLELYQAGAYRHYLARRYGAAAFGPGCRVSDDCSFGEGVSIGARCVLADCEIGRYTSVGFESHYTACRIGGFCSLGPQVLAGLGRHPVDQVSTYPGFYSPHHRDVRGVFVRQQKYVESLPITIGHDVWIGARAILLDGVSISDGAVVAAGAVVTEDVGPYAIVGGVPARVIRKRFDDAAVAQLLQVKWWDQPSEWIAGHADTFADPALFLQSFRTIER